LPGKTTIEFASHFDSTNAHTSIHPFHTLILREMGFFSRLRRVLSFRPKKPPVETPRPPEACLQQVPANEQSIPTPNSRDLFQEAGFLISIETLKGEIFFIRVQSTHTVSQVKAQIEKRRGFPVELQRLVYDEKQLEDEHTVEETRIHTHGTVYLVLHARPTPLADRRSPG
jgi:ubiquitin-like protein Nedd8